MEHLENDMDDLFQKAGELYPLKITESDWDAVAGKLQNDIPGEVQDLSGSTAVRTRNKRKWLLLLLLIPLGLGISYYSGHINPGRQNAISAKPLNTAVDQNKSNRVVPDNHAATVVPTNKNRNAASDNAQTSPDKRNTAENSHSNRTQAIKSKRPVYSANEINSTANSKLNLQKQMAPAAGNTKADLNSTGSNQGLKEKDAAIADKPVNNASSAATESVAKKEAAAVPAAIIAQNQAEATENKTDKTDLSKKASQDSSVAKKKTNTDSKQSKGFYVGLFAGPDVSTVKFQSVNRLGFSLGALVGYRFNNRISVETGLIWDKKYYYSNGEYYKKDGVSLPPTTTLNGYCSMFEIPVAIRFDFATKKNHGYFAKTGLSSYLMMSENYTFNSPAYPSVQWKNNNLQNNIFSILQISGGYERVINDKTKVRVEPYVKIPLQGIGGGQMPISSFGIYFGITHSFR